MFKTRNSDSFFTFQLNWMASIMNFDKKHQKYKKKKRIIILINNITFQHFYRFIVPTEPCSIWSVLLFFK
jgi:hypothetical protein